MRRSLSMLLVAASVLATVSQAEANWLTRAWTSFSRDFRRNNAWPEPFNFADRDAARAPFTIMIAKGWKRQNTFTAHHFDADTGKLTESGRLKLDWILHEAPQQHRMLFVERGVDNRATTDRVLAVKEVSRSLIPQGPELEVFVNMNTGQGAPADTINATYTKWRDSIPAPVLPAASGEEE